jgi:hypothetical protein
MLHSKYFIANVVKQLDAGYTPSPVIAIRRLAEKQSGERLEGEV